MSKCHRPALRRARTVDLDYVCLTHPGVKGLGAQGRGRAKVLRLAPISGLKSWTRQVIWQRAIRVGGPRNCQKPMIRRLESLLAA